MDSDIETGIKTAKCKTCHAVFDYESSERIICGHFNKPYGPFGNSGKEWRELEKAFLEYSFCGDCRVRDYARFRCVDCTRIHGTVRYGMCPNCPMQFRSASTTRLGHTG